MDMDTTGFTDLLSQAEQLTAEMDAGADLPRVKRNLPQILEAGQRLWARNAQLGQDAADVKASILLGAKGYDVPKISQTLEGLSTMKTFEPLEPLHDTDIQGFLKNERENALLAVIEQSRKRTMEAIQTKQWESLELEWEQDKQKILNALVGTNQEFLPFAQESTLLEDTVNMQGRSSLDNVEMAYSREVYVYNEDLIRGGIPSGLVDRFLKVAKELDDKNMIDLWSQMKYMVEVPTETNQNMPTRQTDTVNAKFITQALTYLEHSYKQYMTATIYENLHRAQLGGVPGTVQLVRSFLNVKQLNSVSLEDGCVDGQPLWAMIYYCLRCGDTQAALEVVNRVVNKVGDFATFIQQYANTSDKRLSPANETKIRLQYRRIIRNSRDPYKRAVYCVVGRCDSSDDHPEIADKIDDYLWIKLNHTCVKTQESTQELFTLSQLQHLLYVDFGESHFAAYQQPFLFVQVLLLTAQFEAAIEFLSRMDKLRCHAVHIALALHELKLLNMSTSVQSQLLTKENVADNATIYNINLSRLIMLYTRKFEATDSREALQYFYSLRNITGPNGDNLFMSCVSELAQETREFDMLLGRLERDGKRRPGAIDKFQSDTQKIIEVVAKDTESKGLFEDAVKLYDLAKNPDKVLELLNKLLGQVVSQAGANQSTRDRLRALGISIAERYKTLKTPYSQSTSSTFYLLLDLLTFFDLYHTATYDKALQVIHQLKLLPLTTDTVERKVNDFKHYNDEVRRCLPDVLLATMNSLLNLYKNNRSSTINQSPSLVSHSPSMVSLGTTDGGKETYNNYLRGQAKSLIMFAGMLPYRMPGDTNARLVQMEVLMN